MQLSHGLFESVGVITTNSLIFLSVISPSFIVSLFSKRSDDIWMELNKH